jgi:sugar O-acyltransferase (sialic acid O-acetyltransferase NeuD family)
VRRLVVVAASGLAREVLVSGGVKEVFHHIEVVDDNRDLWGSDLAGFPIAGGLEHVGSNPDVEVLVAAGHGRVRRSIVERLARQGVDPHRHTTVVHPRVSVPPGCSLGRGTVVLEGAILTADIRVGHHVVMMPRVTLTHDDLVQDYATLCAGVTLGGGVTVGTGAYVGMNASVREGVRIGACATLGMGSALLQDMPDGQVWAGVPARPL